MRRLSGPAEGVDVGGGWNRLTAGLAVLALALGAAGTATAAVRTAAPSAAVRHSGVPDGAEGPAPETTIAVNPARVRVPAIGVEAELDALGLNPDGTLEVPPYDRAGWYRGGPKPGEAGPAVIAAHVDSTTGPAVFHRLKALRAGDVVHVDYDDGTAAEFVVSGADSYRKSEFPTERVYGGTDGAELRLITCGGAFDRRARSYVENLVVFAAATPTARVGTEGASS